MSKLVFITGAGISAESGIPTFRDSSGIWEKYNPAEVATHKAIVENPKKVYDFINKFKNEYKDCKPNQAHKIIAELEKEYDVTVVTQNIDNLHELAGSTNVIHLHGDISVVRAIDDENLLFDYNQDITPETIIEGHHVRPHIVLFGEDVPNMLLAIEELKNADICVVVGTSFEVYPAAGLIQYVDVFSPIYYIDPNPAYLQDFPDIKEIKMNAINGLKKLKDELRGNCKK